MNRFLCAVRRMLYQQSLYDTTHGANGRVYVEWKWLMGPFPFPKSDAVLIPASIYLQADLTAGGTSAPLARLDAIAALVYQFLL
jgi:hypothetical protein